MDKEEAIEKLIEANFSILELQDRAFRRRFDIEEVLRNAEIGS